MTLVEDKRSIPLRPKCREKIRYYIVEKIVEDARAQIVERKRVAREGERRVR